MSCLAEVASQYGRYHYLLDGAPTAIEEHWSRKPRAGGGWFIHTERVAAGVTLSVNAECAAGLVLQCQLEWLADGHEPVRALYRSDNNVVSAIRQRAEETPQSQVFSADEKDRLPLVLPLLRIFTGPVIKRLLDRGGEGDVLVMFTDGLVEAREAKGRFYGVDRLVETVRRNRARDAGAVSQAILDDFVRHCSGSSPNDDVTLVVVRCVEGEEEEP